MELARAEVQSNPRVSEPMRAFSNVRLDDAEKGVHRVLKSAGYTSPVEITGVDLDPGLRNFPIIKLSSWMQHLLDTNRLARQMTGVPTIAKMKPVLKEFWNRYKRCFPGHGLWSLEQEGIVSLDTLIPFYSHSDEGRSFKHMPIFILSCHGAIGRGTRAYLGAGKHRAPLRRNSMGLNFAGKTWSTNFIFCSALKTVSSRYPNAVPKLIQEFALDVKHLLETGIYSQDGATHVQFYHSGTKGDLPALKTLGSFKRSFSNVPRGGSTKRPCQGICFLCSAGREATPGVGAIPYEDVNPTALWVSTISQEVPWDSTPAIVQGLPLDEHHQMKFFLTDLWHNAHLGVCRHFVASAIVGILESRLASLPAGSMEVKFDWISRVYRDYFQSIGKTPFVTEINRDAMNFPASTASPLTKWSKAQASTELMMFLSYFGRNYIHGHTDDALLVSIAPSFENSCKFLVLGLEFNPLLHVFYEPPKMKNFNRISTGPISFPFVPSVL